MQHEGKSEKIFLILVFQSEETFLIFCYWINTWQPAAAIEATQALDPWAHYIVLHSEGDTSQRVHP